MGHRSQRVQCKCVHILLISPTVTFYILYDVDHTQQRMTETWMKVAGEGKERDVARQYRIIHREGCPDGNGEYHNITWLTNLADLTLSDVHKQLSAMNRKFC